MDASGLVHPARSLTVGVVRIHGRAPAAAARAGVVVGLLPVMALYPRGGRFESCPLRSMRDRRAYYCEWRRKKHAYDVPRARGAHKVYGRLSAEDKQGVLALLSAGVSQTAIAKAYGVVKQTISRVRCKNDRGD